MSAVVSGRQATLVSFHDTLVQGSLLVISLQRKNTMSEDIASYCSVVWPLCRAKKTVRRKKEVTRRARRASNGMSSEEYMQERLGRMRGLVTIGPDLPVEKCLLSAGGKRAQVVSPAVPPGRYSAACCKKTCG